MATRYFRNRKNGVTWHMARPESTCSYATTGRWTAYCYVIQRVADVDAEQAGLSIGRSMSGGMAISPSAGGRICPICRRLWAEDKYLDKLRREYLEANQGWIDEWDAKIRDKFMEYFNRIGPPDHVEKSLAVPGDDEDE